MMKTIRYLLLAGMCLVPAAQAAWMSPVSHLDEEGGRWSNLANAYDNPAQPHVTYAASTPRLGWAGWADFSLAAPVSCGRVRVYCDFGYGRVDSVQVDVWNSAMLEWQGVHAGTVADCEYTELVFTPRSVSAMRFRFHYVLADWQFWLHEVGFYEAPFEEFVYPPELATLDATSVNGASAALHGLLTSDGGEPCETWFEYGPTVSYGSTTPVRSGYITGQTFGAFLSGLSGTYHFRAVVGNSADTTYGDDLSFTVNLVPLSGWISPVSSYSDPTPPTPNSGGWSNRTMAYDDEGRSGASLVHAINDASPMAYLYLALSDTLDVDKIRFQAKKTPEIASIDVWVLRDGVWTNVYPLAAFNDAADGTVWNEVSFAAGRVTEARVRFSVPANFGLSVAVYEFDFHTVGVERCWAFVDGAFGAASK